MGLKSGSRASACSRPPAVGGEPIAVEALARRSGRSFARRPIRSGLRWRCRAAWTAPSPCSRRGRRRSGSRSGSGSTRPGRMREGLLLAGLGAPGARHLSPARTAARDARSARAVLPRGGGAVRALATRAGGRRTPACAATAASASRGCLPSPGGPGRRDWRPATTRASSSATGDCSWPAPATAKRISPTCSPRSIQACSRGSGSRSPSASKAETRARARAAGLTVADRAESQEACFLAGADYRDFLERRGLVSRRGEIVDERGNRLGEHDGYWRFTPGQRRGLGIASASGRST